MVQCSLSLGLVRGFVGPRVAAEVVGDWAVLEESPVLGVAYQQPKFVELAPFVGKNVCSVHRPRKQNKGSLFVSWDFYPAWAGDEGFGW